MVLRIEWSESSIIEDGATGETQIQEALHSLEFDAVLEIRHSSSGALTDHAVESVASLADHKRPENDRLSITALITNAPISDPPPSGYSDNDGARAIHEVVMEFDRSFDRRTDVLYSLQRLASEATIVVVSTASRIYDQMTVISAEAVRTSDTGDAIEVVIDLQRVRVAHTRTIDAPVPLEPRGRRASDVGAHEASEASEDSSSEDRRSLLSRALDQYSEVLGL